jgi:hypothetical protein
VYSATPGTQSNRGVAYALVVGACGNQDGQCLHTGALTNNQVEATVLDSSSETLYNAKIHLIVY